MTSWKKRINFVAKAIFRFLESQDRKPDMFYLWLAEEEFPNKENDLPRDLLLICESLNVKLCWTKENEYCFKRWHVYPTHYNDLVISIDDDIIFPSDLVSNAATHLNEENHVYNIFKCFTFEYFSEPRKFCKPPSMASSVKYNWLGCSIVCPRTFPLECLSEENMEIRSIVCKRCDETWIKPFSLMHNTPISFIDTYCQDEAGSQDDAQHKILCKNIDRNFRLIDYQWFYRISVFSEEMKSKFFEVFPAYKYDYDLMKSIPFERIKEIVENNQ